MGRGIVESGLFRSERYRVARLTSDPATHEEGEAWIRTDIAPDANQLATLRFDYGSGIWDVPIYDVTATTENVSKAWRVHVNGATGFIPIAETGAAHPALRLQHNGTPHGVHNALTASTIPDSVDYQWSADTYQTGDGTWTDDVGGVEMDMIGGLQRVTLSDGSAGVSGDGTDDIGLAPMPETGNLSNSSWELSMQSASTEVGPRIMGVRDANSDKQISMQMNRDVDANQDQGNIRIVVSADTQTTDVWAPSTSPGLFDGNRHNLSVIFGDLSNQEVTIIVDGTNQSIDYENVSATGSYTFSNWDKDVGFFAQNASPKLYSEVAIANIRHHGVEIAGQTIGQ